ncbi:fibronectin type III domain-containing protein 7 isoform X2 [Alligator mississippiensis]|uniref:fibronectin type III domain-containing protein 7 isoform X2 n=1 Tax=Alligator mississippiensis TaxID=8496 RepID=UPI0009076AD2|nr:fibronectin type III domain-containing protein 7 isoform X2 [Alligator mississippiensis]
MGGRRHESVLYPALTFASLAAVISANTGFSISIYDVTSRSIYLRWLKFSGAVSYRVTASPVNVVGHSVMAHFSDVTLIGILTPLTPNTIHTVEVEAIDENGIILAEAQTMQLTAPEMPIIDQAYSKLSNSITVEWTAVPGATSYLLTAQDGESFIETIITNSPGTVTGLKAATLYKITIRSINSGGKSQPSPSRKAKTVLAAPVLSASSPSYDSIVVSWGAVHMAVGFSVSIMRSDGLGNMVKENTTNTSLVFTSLDSGTLYTIKAHAWNVNGIPGDDFIYNQRTSPQAPADVQVVFDSGALKAIISWTPTEGTLNYSVTASNRASKLNCVTSSTSCSIASLHCGSVYSICVIASNHAGSSKPTDSVSLKTVPCAPGSITIEEEDPGNLSVSWSNVDLGEYYVVFVKSDDGLEVHCNTSHTQCHFQSDCGFMYFISVFAYNKAGQSPSGEVLNYTTAPCSPEITNISKDALSIISVYWQSNNDEATYIVTARGEAGLWHCTSSGNSCSITNLPCGSVFFVSVVASTTVGQSLPSYSIPFETAPCCPNDLTLTQLTQSVTNISWSAGTGAQTYVTVLESPKGWARCHTLQNQCLLGCITCGTNYTVSLKAISETGLTSDCTYQGYSSSACCPFGVKLYRLGNNGIRIYWRASTGLINYTTHLYGSKGNFTCTPKSGLRFCDVTEIPCGDIYTVMVSPITDKGTKPPFCPKKIYSVTCSGSSVGMVIYRGKRSAE